MNRTTYQHNKRETDFCAIVMTEETRHDEPNQAHPERIYIGGLDPPFLKPSDVIKRLESLASISIVNPHFDDNKAFFHVNALPLGDERPFKVVSKAYNNVKWKGCRITVQQARPHFLQRLENERQEREVSNHCRANIRAQAETDHVKNPDPVVLRRRLRIRQKYGSEAYRVDTKPCETTDWDNFEKIVRQMRTRRDRTPNAVKKQKGVARVNKTQSFYSRAVHLRFGEDCVDTPLLVDGDPESHHKRNPGDGEAVLVDDDLDSDDSSSESDPSPKDRVTVSKGLVPKAYDWSTDDSSDGDSDDDNDLKSNAATTTNFCVDRSTDLTSIQDEMANNVNVQAVSQGADNQYQWSSDESDDEVCAPPPQALPAITEFESAIDFDGDDGSDDDGSAESYSAETKVAESDSDGLQQDVENNLNVLSQLFPDLKDATPKHVGITQDSHAVGWKASSMQRYDPTKESSQQFELKEGKFEVVAVDDQDMHEVDDRNVGMHGDADVSEAEEDLGTSDDRDLESPIVASVIKDSTTEGNVYCESQLEEVFRRARDSGEGGGFQVSALFGEQPDELKEKEKLNKDASGPFSFGFNLESSPAVDGAKRNDGLALISEVTEPTKLDDERMSDVEMTAENTYDFMLAKKRPRRRGLMLPDSVIDHYYNKFFELNDGLAIQQDPEGFRNDETVKADWHKERHALTQDWKRKRKYALSRLQKNNKFRK